MFYSDEDVRSGTCEMELATAAAKGRFESEGWRIRKDGSRFWAGVVIGAVRDADGKLMGFSKVTRDLTSTRLAEESRVRLIQAQEALRLRDEFLSIASHELKTPLTSLQLQLHAIVKQLEQADKAFAAKVHRILRSSDRLGSLVEALLDVSRITTGRLTLAPVSFDLRACFGEVTDRMTEEAQRAGCRIVFDAAGPPVLGTWDRNRLEQVLTNLLSNALKYAPGSPVEVELVGTGNEAIFTVTDHGPGIPASELSRIFGRFERAAPMQHYGGLGLGLFIARQIATSHGGTIEVDSEPGIQTRFTVRIPRAPPEVDVHSTNEP